MLLEKGPQTRADSQQFILTIKGLGTLTATVVKQDIAFSFDLRNSSLKDLGSREMEYLVDCEGITISRVTRKQLAR